jgi:hypothetical protein
MANTVIQLKFSNITATPTTLNVAEPAYSYTSNTLFIGSPAGTGSIAIGGKFYLDQQQIIFNTANAAFTAANTGAASAGAFNQANAAFIAANSAGAYANSAFLAANAAQTTATSAGVYANGAFAAANAAQTTATSAGIYANGAFATANNEAGVNLTQNNSIAAAFAAANAATATDTTQNNSITAAFAAANAAQVTATSAGVYANGAFVAANTSQASATAAFIRANNSISANAGGTITGSLVVTGNLTVQGNTTFVDTEILSVEDSLIKLANNNTADTLDIGFYGQYNSTGTKYAGLARNAASDNFFLFKGLTADPAGNTLATGSVTAANAATLIANVSAYSITIGGQNIQTYTDNAYNTANAAFAKANTQDAINLTQNNSITAAFSAANTAQVTATSAGVYANGAFVAANTAQVTATSAGVYANGAFAAANAATATNLTQNNSITAAFAAANAATATDLTQNNSIAAAFTAANSAGVYANGAFAAANTDFTGVTITAANHGTASAVASFRVEANGRISSANNTAIAIDTSAITSGTLGVARGGTGAGTFTTNGVLLGQGTSALTTASSATEGHVLTINASGVPTFAHLQGGTF